MKKIFTLIAICSLFGSTTVGQNLVQNPSFETVNTGSLLCSWYVASTEFSSAISNWTYPSDGSTDIFHSSLATSCYCSPYSTNAAANGPQAPRTGSSMSALCTYGNGGCSPSYREYVQGHLSSSMVVGQQYCVEFYVSMADYNQYASNNIGVYFSTGSTFQSTMCPLSVTPQLNNTAVITDATNWTLISFTFTPTAAYNYFVIGNFYSDAATSHPSAGGSRVVTRYYIDDVSVQLCTVNPTITVNNPTICSGQTATLTASSTVTGTTYSWSTGGTGSSITVNPTTTTSYTVTGTSPSGGTGTATATVTVNPKPTVTATASPTSVCSGASSSLSAGGASTYSWSNGSTGTPISVAPTTTTSYTVTGTSAAGCTNTASVSVTVNPTPTVASTNATVCQGVAATLTASGAAVYSWSTGAGTTSITVSPSSTTTYTVTGTNALGCTATASGTVTVNPNPTVSASASPASVCPGNPSTLTGSGASTYAWSTGASGTTTTVNPTSTTSYTVTGTSAAGCTGTATVSVTVLAGPIVTTTGATICEGETANISASGATNYAWDNNMNGGSISVNPTTTTTYTVSGTDGGGCTGLATATVIVNPLPTISVNQPSICSGTTANLTASGASTYVWSTSDITASIQVSPLATTSYVVTGTDANGCENTASATVTVNPNPVVNVISTPDYCASANGTAAANAISGTMPYDYLWNTSQTTATISSLPAGQYNVTVSDANGCTESGVVTVSPQAGFTLGANSTQEHCDMLDGTAEIVASNATMPLNYSWSHNIGLNSPIANGLAAGSYSVTVTDGQCTLTIEVTVGFHDGPNAGFHPSSTTTNAGEGNITFSDQSTGALIWYYEFGDGGISTEQNPIYQYLTPGVYYPMQVVADQFGCTDTAYQTINANEGFAFFIPSAFSPNGDGRNDFFTVSGYGIDLNTFQMSIYDRWGHIVFRTSDINKQWDGQYFMSEEIDDVTQGVYSYHITFKTSSGKDKNYFGHVVKLP